MGQSLGMFKQQTTQEQEDIDFLKSSNYGIKVIYEGKAVHWVLYPNPPTEEDFLALGEELAIDEEFGLQQIADNAIYERMTIEEVIALKKDMKII